MEEKKNILQSNNFQIFPQFHYLENKKDLQELWESAINLHMQS